MLGFLINKLYEEENQKLEIDYINFHSPPYIGEDSKGKVIELAKALKKFQYKGRVYVVNFSKFQSAIKLLLLSSRS